MKRSRPRSFALLGKYDAFLPGWGGLLGVCLLILLGTVLGGGLTFLLQRTVGAEMAGRYGILLSYPLMFLPAMVYAGVKGQMAGLDRQLRGLPPEYPIDTPLSRRNGTAECRNAAIPDKRSCGAVAALITAALAATVCLAILADALGNLLPPMPPALKAALETLLEGPLWVSVLSACIFAPFFEEWLCRGIVLRSLLRRCPPAVAILLSALFFALLHANPWQALPAFLIGGLMGWVYFRTGSLKLTIAMHALNNGLSLLLSRIDALQGMDTLREAFPNPAVYVTLLTAALLLLAANLGFLKKSL